MDNQFVAQILFEHGLASQENILACWPYITSEKDVAHILVERGLLAPATYQELMSYMQGLSNPVAQGPASSMESPGVAQQEHSPVSKDEAWSMAGPENKSESLAEIKSNEMGVESGIVQMDLGPSELPKQELRVREPKTRVPESLHDQVTWQELLAYARHQEASDIHLSSGNPILLRRNGSLQPMTGGPIDHTKVRKWVEAALDSLQLKAFDEKGDLEIIYTLPHWGRYRVTVMKQRRGVDITARVIPSLIRSMEDAGLPEPCRDLTRWAQGLVLVTGPVGCGKSSTLATFVEAVNQERHDHIITIEEPIEIVYEPALCRITQREIGPHTLNRDAALRAALREDPDIIVISELRDLDTIRLAISAAETGHLVFGTMNTTNATRTIYRLIDSFPPEEQGIIRNMISESLRGIVSQQLIPRKDGQGMIPAYEVLLITSAVSNMIRKDEAHQLGTAMITGKSHGMVLFDDSLRTLVSKGLIDPAEAMARATSPKDFEKFMGRRG
jgi:twitching motility protein PilT